MAKIIYDDKFLKEYGKIKDRPSIVKIDKQINKIMNFPEMGKPMRYGRKGTREVYVSSFRISYAYYTEKQIIEFLEIYHKDEQ